MRQYWWVACLWIIGAVLAVWMNYGPNAASYANHDGECGAGAWKYDC